MNEYTFLFRGRQIPSSLEEMQKTTETWMAWFKELGQKGHIKDLGHPLEPNGKVVRGSQLVTDGPYMETKDVVGGFTVILASDLEQAVEIAKGCPILAVGGAVEVRPIQKMNM
jgi:hypothetical protein